MSQPNVDAHPRATLVEPLIPTRCCCRTASASCRVAGSRLNRVRATEGEARVGIPNLTQPDASIAVLLTYSSAAYSNHAMVWPDYFAAIE